MMSEDKTTQVPAAGGGGLTGWVIGLAIILAGMVVAGFILDAGQVWVVPETQSYVGVATTDVATTGVDSPLEWSAVGSDAANTAEAAGTVVARSSWVTVTELPAGSVDRPAGAVMSWNRTIGVWLAAILTLCIMSFLLGDNPFYKTAEALVVGASAAYAMVYSFYTGIVDQLLVNLWPGLVRGWTTPGLADDYDWHWIYIIPLILSIMLVCRLLPSGGWIARWPLAFIIGATAGFRLLAHLESDFLLQIKGTITTLWWVNAADEFQFWPSVAAIVILLSVLACLVYFFFSMEHKGMVGKTARGGILVLMVTFGAAFGLTVMGRITLLTERFDFLFKDWLHLL